jgi:heme/copper-type cytochrome/quinol oxidase subunit 4
MIHWNWHALIGPSLSVIVFFAGLVIQGIVIHDSSKSLSEFFGADARGNKLPAKTISEYRTKIREEMSLAADAVQFAAVALTVPFAVVFLFSIPADVRYVLVVGLAIVILIVALLITRLPAERNHLWKYFSWTSAITAVLLVIYAILVLLCTPIHPVLG